jgi:hypothetical protein
MEVITRAPHHPQQAARLRKLRSFDILDTEREGDFDDVVRLASNICGTAISVVILIEDFVESPIHPAIRALQITPWSSPIPAFGFMQACALSRIMARPLARSECLILHPANCLSCKARRCGFWANR